MGFMYKVFSDVKGDPSTNRLISAFVAVFPLCVWGYSVFKSGVWMNPPEELLLLVAGGLTSKIVQRKIEQGDCNDAVTENIKNSLRSYLAKSEGKNSQEG
jgi:hypothetical protein